MLVETVKSVDTGSPLVSPASGTHCSHLAAAEELAAVEGLDAVEELAAVVVPSEEDEEASVAGTTHTAQVAGWPLA